LTSFLFDDIRYYKKKYHIISKRAAFYEMQIETWSFLSPIYLKLSYRNVTEDKGTTDAYGQFLVEKIFYLAKIIRIVKKHNNYQQKAKMQFAA
jgi:hypothetical protein